MKSKKTKGKKVVVFGAGWLGNQIQPFLNGFGYDVDMPDRISGDIAEPMLVRRTLDLCKPDIVINAAGKTGTPNIDWCNKNRANRLATLRSNVTGPLVLLDECLKRGIRLAHISSGCIFDGPSPKEGGWTEKDIPNPNSFYARTKARADAILQEYPVLILRIRMPVSGELHQRNLIYKLARYPKVIDVLNSVTVVGSFLHALRTLLDEKKSGIYNVANPGPVRHADIMKWYGEIVEPGHKYEIVPPEDIAKLATDGRSNCILNTAKLEKVVTVGHAEPAIRACLQQYNSWLDHLAAQKH